MRGKTLLLRIVKILFVICCIIAIAFCIFYAVMHKIGSSVTYQERQATQYNEETLKDKQVHNILLIGSDARADVSGNRSDVMLLVSINSKTKRIILTSFQRDCYVEIPDVGGNRLNAAYAYGGADLTVRTIEQNFNIAIDHYVIIDFDIVINAINALGGVEISLETEELDSGSPDKPTFNQYVNELNELYGFEYGTNFITAPGVYQLNGYQALSYARIRYTAGNDFARTNRQREIIVAILKQCSIPKIISAVQTVAPQIITDFTANEIAMFALNALEYVTYDINQLSIPELETHVDVNINGMAVLQIDFNEAHQTLADMIYN